ncbi:MAG TPA: nucleotidyltransferase domain-containing protein [Candidatus Limnocylindria bacterium]
MAGVQSPLRSREELTALADGPAVTGIAVLGSVARGDASEWSDIDIEATVSDVAAKWDTRPSFIDGRLVMCHSITAAEQWRQLELPDKAIWAAPSYAAMLILVDRDHGLAKLQAACRAFDYSTLRPAATAYLRQKATAACEYVFKIRDAVGTRDEAKVLHAAAALSGRCERLVAVAFMTPIQSENEYYRVVQHAAGPAWTAAHRASYGLDGGDAFAQAVAGCGLFRETMRLIDDRLDAAARAIVGPTLEIAP